MAVFTGWENMCLVYYSFKYSCYSQPLEGTLSLFLMMYDYYQEIKLLQQIKRLVHLTYLKINWTGNSVHPV